LKQGDALTPLLFNLDLDYAMRRFQVNQDGLKLNGTHQLLVCAVDVNILGGSVHTIRENAEDFLDGSKETGLEVNADKTKYMSIYRDQNAGRSHNMKIYNHSFEKMEQFKYLVTTLTNQNSIHEEIKARLMSRNACYHSVQNLLPSSLLSKNIKITIYRTIILPVVLYWCETLPLTLREECRLRVFEKRVLRRIFGSKRDEVRGQWKRLHNEKLYDLYFSQNIFE
jgi:hypothetical protein